MWLWLKTQVARLMMALGVDWPGMSDGDKLNALISIVVGLIGIGIGLMGYRIAKRATDIADIQHQLLEAERARIPSVFLYIENDPDKIQDGIAYYSVKIHNNSKNTRAVLSKYRVTLRPDGIFQGIRCYQGWKGAEIPAKLFSVPDANNRLVPKYSDYEIVSDAPIFVGQPAGVATIAVNRTQRPPGSPNPITFWWGVATEYSFDSGTDAFFAATGGKWLQIR